MPQYAQPWNNSSMNAVSNNTIKNSKISKNPEKSSRILASSKQSSKIRNQLKEPWSYGAVGKLQRIPKKLQAKLKDFIENQIIRYQQVTLNTKTRSFKLIKL